MLILHETNDLVTWEIASLEILQPKWMKWHEWSFPVIHKVDNVDIFVLFM